MVSSHSSVFIVVQVFLWRSAVSVHDSSATLRGHSSLQDFHVHQESDQKANTYKASAKRSHLARQWPWGLSFLGRFIKGPSASSNEYIVIMGQLLTPDADPTDVLKKRVEKAAAIFKEIQGRAHVIVSGGDPCRRGRTEAAAMKEMLLKMDVPKASIIEERNSKNTLQNAVYVFKMLGKKEPIKLHLVTSDFHMPRTAYVYEAALAHAKSKGGPGDIELERHPATGGCPEESGTTHYNVNQMTYVERLQLEKGFLANEHFYLKKDSPENDKVEPLPEKRLKEAQEEVNDMLKLKKVSSSDFDSSWFEKVRKLSSCA